MLTTTKSGIYKFKSECAGVGGYSKKKQDNFVQKGHRIFGVI